MGGEASSLQWIYREKDLSIGVKHAYSLWGRQMKILHLLQFDPGVELPGHGIQINSCSVYLVDIKKEKPFFNSTVDRQAQARTNCNQASDIIGKYDCMSV